MTFRLKIKFHLIAVAFLLMVCPVKADVFKLGEIGLLKAGEELNYQFTVTGPIISFDNSNPVWPSGCISDQRVERILNSRKTLSYSLTCLSALKAGQEILTMWQLDGVRYTSNVAEFSEGISLVPLNGVISVPISSNQLRIRPIEELAETYILQGIWHIWQGWDHLAFVLCLCFMYRGRMLIGLVTIFTVGHSITLGLSYFDFVKLNMPPVEALIALSIVFMAREAIKNTEHKNQAIMTGISFIGLFGLLHGLGFASALGELGAAPEEKLKVLFFFNVGVEIGQIAFIIAAVPILLLISSIKFSKSIRYLALTCIGTLGGFWTIERIAGF
ncbi:MAG: HupE/UreJ family protein [Emcibacteraceae bacterium]|nr:HupE/UreJ family protein [Emcibacteraceae bacterium]